MDYDFNNKTTLGKIKVLMLKGEQGKTGHGAYAAYDVAEMTDKQQIYVYTGPTDSTYTRGDWYYWDEEDEAWTSGGAYNSYALTTDPTLSIEGDAADAEATGEAIAGVEDKVSRISGVSSNLFDAYIFENIWYNADGSTYSAQNVASSEYIEIDSGEYYTLSTAVAFRNLEIVWFGNDKSFISRDALTLDSGNKHITATAPNSAAFAKVGMYAVSGSRITTELLLDSYKVMFSKGATVPEYVPRFTAADYVARGMKPDLDNALLTIEKTTETTLNLFDAYIYTNEWYGANGSTQGGQYVASSDYIGITAGQPYTLSSLKVFRNLEIVWFSSAKAFIDRAALALDSGGMFITATAPSNAAYAKIGVYADSSVAITTDLLLNVYKVMFAAGSAISEYVPHITGIDYAARNYAGYAEYKGQRISILGDSLSTFGGSASDPASQRISDGTYTYIGNRCRYPQNNLLTDVRLTYWYSLIEHFGMELGINDSWAGSRVSWDGQTEGADVGADKYIASPTRIGHLGENGTPDIILINAGTNDIIQNVPVGTFDYSSPMGLTEEEIAALPVATFADAYRTLLIRLLYSYPDSMLLVMLPNYTAPAYYDPQKEDSYSEIIKEACDYFGVKWFDTRTCGVTVFNYETYIGDGVHYNADGMRMLSKNLAKYIKYNFTTFK